MADRLETLQLDDSDDATLVIKDGEEFRASRKLLSVAMPFFFCAPRQRDEGE